jgi:hypothetical protein
MLLASALFEEIQIVEPAGVQLPIVGEYGTGVLGVGVEIGTCQ